MSSGITDTGFVKKELEEILTDKNEVTRSVFGDEINLSPESPDGQINGLLAASDADLWALAEAVYNAFNPAASSGVTLDNLVGINGINRLNATSSRVSLDITGTNGTIIPIGSLVTNGTNQFATLAEVEISGGVATVDADSVETGPIVALAGTLTTIVNPIVGWDTVTNPSDATLGSEEETDAELRARREASVAFPSQAMIDSIFASVSNVDGVRSVTVLENDTDAVDPNGQPAHSVQAVVEGGDDTEIAEAIFRTKPAGIQAFGSTTVPVDDSQGFSHDIGLTRPTSVPIYVIVNLTTFAGEFPASGEDDIKDAIVEYADLNFRTGDDVIYSRLFTPINSVPGHQIDSLFIGTSPAPVGTSNITIAFDEIAEFTVGNITVNV